ncbi:MAG: hypothetical protein ACPGVG_09495 [Mycobacterium sp.]
MSNFDYWEIATGEGISDYELHERYDEMLDAIYGDAAIGGMTYSTARALKEVDPIAYRVGFGDWVDSELGETITETEPAA